MKNVYHNSLAALWGSVPVVSWLDGEHWWPLSLAGHLAYHFVVCLLIFLMLMLVRWLRTRKPKKKNLAVVAPSMKHYRQFLSDLDSSARKKYNIFPAVNLYQLRGKYVDCYIDLCDYNSGYGNDYNAAMQRLMDLANNFGATEIFEL